MYLDEICEMLDSYSGRDKVMRTLCYSMKLAAGLTAARNPELSTKFQIISSQMSATRATLRLFDDLPMLQCTLQYGLGKHEPDAFISLLGIITNAVDQLYYPIEKICWLVEHKLITVKDASKWDTLSSLFWVASIYLTLMKTLRNVRLLQTHKRCLNRDSQDSGVALSRLIVRQNMEYLTCIRLTLDLVHSVSTLPPGWLWGCKIETWKVGLIGTISSLLGVYQYFARKHSNKL